MVATASASTSHSGLGQGHQKSSAPARTIKKRTGCEQCKRRKVRCDEKKPSCARCMRRGETCTGNFRLDQWQIERPWLSTEQRVVLPAPALENDLLRHWYDKACLIMSLFPPPVNPLSYHLSPLLARSRALRHAVQCVAEAHRADFTASEMTPALQERNLAIVSLRGEVSRAQASPHNQMLLRTIILSSLLLCLSASWLDPLGKEFGGEFLVGARTIAYMLSQDAPTDNFAFYVIGLLLYCEAFSSYLEPMPQLTSMDETILHLLSQPPYNTLIHPVTGLSTSLCPILTEIGRFYRFTVDSRTHSEQHERQLRDNLCSWNPPVHNSNLMQLRLVAEAYRNLGDIMLYQARRVVAPLSDSDSGMLKYRVNAVIETIKHTPKNDVLLNWTGSSLAIAGSELPSDAVESRLLVSSYFCYLIDLTKIHTYSLAFELVKELWYLHDQGFRISWLELMLAKNWALQLG